MVFKRHARGSVAAVVLVQPGLQSLWLTVFRPWPLAEVRHIAGIISPHFRKIRDLCAQNGAALVEAGH